MIQKTDESPLAAAKSIGEIAQSLAGIARDAHLPVLAYLLDMVVLHCADLAHVQSKANGRDDLAMRK